MKTLGTVISIIIVAIIYFTPILLIDIKDTLSSNIALLLYGGYSAIIANMAGTKFAKWFNSKIKD